MSNANPVSMCLRFMAAGWLVCTVPFIGRADESLPAAETFKKLSLEQLLDMEVTSVSRRPEKLSETASAIQVITGEDIRHSGASSIPEALRLAPNLQVAQKGSHNWAHNIEFDVGVRWVDSLRINNVGVADKVPDYCEMDVRLSWHVTKDLEISVVGQNLLHDQHLEYIIASPNPREEIRRSVYGKVTWLF